MKCSVKLWECEGGPNREDEEDVVQQLFKLTYTVYTSQSYKD